MRSKNQILQEQLKGAEVAINLQNRQGVAVKYERAPNDFMNTVTTSDPWRLGHGSWVVKVAGVSGCVDCGKITIL